MALLVKFTFVVALHRRPPTAWAVLVLLCINGFHFDKRGIMKNAFKFVSAFVFGAALVATPVAFGTDGSPHLAKAFAETGTPSANPDTGAPSANPDTNTPNTGPGGEGGGGGPVTLAARTAAFGSLAATGGEGVPSVNPDTGIPSANPDTGVPNTGPGGEVLTITSLYNVP
jgi:hypothetical protein